MASSLPVLILGGLLLAASGPRQTTDTPSAVLYGGIGYRGPSVALTQAHADLNLPWPVRSIRVNSGVWELCRETRFRGGCRRYAASDGSIPSARAYTQSARPVSAPSN